MSISKAQAQALADGFLDGLGSEKEEFEPRESYTEIILLAGELIEAAQRNLNSSNSNASGALSASLVANEPTAIGNIMRLDILMLYYGIFVNKGVKGTQGGQSSAGYSFKHNFPSKDMLASLAEWAQRGKMSTTNTNLKKSTSRNEQKNGRIGDISNIYGLAVSIKQKGIKATGFLDKAIITTQQLVKERIGAALKIDIINSFSNI